MIIMYNDEIRDMCLGMSEIAQIAGPTLTHDSSIPKFLLMCWLLSLISFAFKNNHQLCSPHLHTLLTHTHSRHGNLSRHQLLIVYGSVFVLGCFSLKDVRGEEA